MSSDDDEVRMSANVRMLDLVELLAARGEDGPSCFGKIVPCQHSRTCTVCLTPFRTDDLRRLTCGRQRAAVARTNASARGVGGG